MSDEDARFEKDPIAIVGMSCRFPGARDLGAFWRLLCEGRDVVTEVPPDRWDINAFYDPDPTAPGKMITRYGSFLEGLDQFDAQFFGISPREAAHLDPRHRLTLELTWEGLEDAGIPPDSLAGTRTGMFMAVLIDEYSELVYQDINRADIYTGLGSGHSILANRVSYFLDLRGPSLAVDTACSGSLVAVHLACQSLWCGESALALAGGVSLNLLPHKYIYFSKARALAPDGRCKTFDARADGYGRADGAAVVVLKRLSRALADKDRIYAVIRSSVVNHDGRSDGITAPNREAQEALLREAYRQAGISPGQVQYVEAHGSGTPLSDRIETQALTNVLSIDRPPGCPCALGAVKTNIGHAEAAAGVAGLIKAALCIEHRLIPPNRDFQEPNPRIPFDVLPLIVQQKLGPWPVESEPLIAGVSGFGVGGANAHVVLEEPPQVDSDREKDPPSLFQAYLLPLSAHSPKALDALARDYKLFLATKESVPSLRDICYSAGSRRSHLEHRLAIVAHSREEMATHLGALVQGEPESGLTRSSEPVRHQRKLAFVFSGQGGQRLGMGRELLEREPVFRTALEQCDQLVRQHAGWSVLERLTADGARSHLDQMDVIQPVLFSIQVALAALWRSWGIVPDIVVGQSMGEVAAAHVAGALSLEHAVQVIVYRSQLLQTPQAQGRMAVVGLPLEQAGLAVMAFEDLVSVAGNYGPMSSVLSGDPETLEQILKSLEKRDIFCRMIRGVDVASHSPQMEPLKDKLVQALKGLQPQPTSLPMLSTVNGDIIAGEQLDPVYWGRNLREPFLFAEVVNKLIQSGYDTFLEIGPHPVLKKAILEGLQHLAQEGTVLPSMRREEQERRTMLASLGALYTMGGSIEWDGVYRDRGQVVSLPTYPWQRERYWFDQLDRGKATGSHAQVGKRAGTHPLLGEHLKSALASGRHFWEMDLCVHSLHYLDEHQVQGAVVLPGSAYLEMALAIAEQTLGTSSSLERVDFRQALYIPEDNARRVQVVLSPETPGVFTFRVFSRPADEEQGEPWTLHASGRIRQDQDSTSPKERPALEEIRARCPIEISSAAHYQAMHERGLEYGPSFQAVGWIWRRDGEALGRLRLPKTVELEASAYRIHPILLDAGFQVVAAAISVAEGNVAARETYLPVGVEDVHVYGCSTPQSWCHVVLRSDDGVDATNEFKADVRLLNEVGDVTVEVLGLHLRRLESAKRDIQEDLEGWLYELRWQPAARLEVGKPAGSAQADLPGRWLVFADSGGVGQALAALLEEYGETSALVFPGREYQAAECGHRYWLNPAHPEEFRQLLDDFVGGAQAPLQKVVHMWGLDSAPVGETTSGSLEEAHAVGCGSALHLVQALVSLGQAEPLRLWLVTQGAQAVAQAMEGETAIQVAQASLWGLGRVVAVEHPECWGGMVDLEPGASPDRAAGLLLEEMRRPDGEKQFAFRGEQRYVARLVRCGDRAAAVQPFRFRSDGGYLITGGLGGLGLQVARWMVEQGARRLILMGRSQLPPRSLWRGLEEGNPCADRVGAIQELEAMGASVHLAAVDVADEAQLLAFLQEYERENWPPIRGVVHAAGLVKDRLMLRMDRETFNTVLRPKVWGTWLLHSLLQEAPLDFFILFSSVASVLGSLGQGNYAAGNAFMDALAYHRRAQGLPAQSISWGPWAKVGIAARLNVLEQHEQKGMYAIAPEQGVELLGRLMRRDSTHVSVMAVDWGQWFQSSKPQDGLSLLSEIAQEESSFGESAASLQAEDDFLKELSATIDWAERQRVLGSRLQGLTAGVLRMDLSRLDPQEPLNVLGMDSIMAVELKSRIEANLGLALSITDLLQGHSIAQLTSKLLSQLQEGAVGSAERPPAGTEQPP